MRRAPALGLALVLPVAALVGGSASAATPTPALSNSNVAVASAAAAGAVASPTKHARAAVINGTVGPGFTIKVDPKTTKAGKYKIVVNDKSDMHNFHIFGPGGIDEATTVSGTGKTVWKLKLVKGTYTIQCDPHSETMHTTLKVT